MEQGESCEQSEYARRPDATEEFNVALADAQWIISIYVLGLGLTMTLVGAVGSACAPSNSKSTLDYLVAITTSIRMAIDALAGSADIRRSSND